MLAMKTYECERVVFLGDYFDCNPNLGEEGASAANTIQRLNQLYYELGDKAIWLFGNHDLHYLAVWRPRNYSVPKTNWFACSGYSRKTAREFNLSATKDWVESWDLACVVNDVTLSHAGFHPRLLKPRKTPFKSVVEWCHKWHDDFRTFGQTPNHWLNDVHHCRGGFSESGSPIWLDWNHEFVPIEGMPQIVGHSQTLEQKWNSMCIDDKRRSFGILGVDKSLIVVRNGEEILKTNLNENGTGKK